ncbi:MAG: thioredoxin family protein [Dysgonomonas sp.]
MQSVTDSNEIETFKRYICDSLDFSELHESALWEPFIQAWINMFKRDNSQEFSDTEFIYTTKMLLDRTISDSPETVKDLVRVMSEILLDKQQQKTAACIVAYSQGVNIAVDEESEIAMRLLTSVMLPGNKAPDISGMQCVKKDSLCKKRLVIFYSSNNEQSESLLAEVIKYYTDLSEKGVSIVSISADTDSLAFDKYARIFPWVDKLCDYKSYSGENFKNYGVTTVPTMYLIDSSGITLSQYNTLKETNLIESEDAIEMIYSDKRLVH